MFLRELDITNNEYDRDWQRVLRLMWIGCGLD
jgi:hypothetical protein